MTEIPGHPVHGAGRYEIRVRGHLHPRWAAWFDGFVLAREGDGTTVLAGRTDQAGLHGVLRTLADIGLPLVSVTPAASDDPTSPTTADPADDVS